MSWRYVVNQSSEGFDIRAYYEFEGGPAWSKRPAMPSGETVEELREDLNRMLSALDRPIMKLNQEDHHGQS